MTLVEFLLARIAEDEIVARATRPGWKAGAETMCATEGSDTVLVAPARVLADCLAKRRIVQACDYDGMTADYVLATLAEVYAGHPDYDEGWRP